MMRVARFALLTLVMAFVLACSCEKEKTPVVFDDNPFYRFMFYNVENLFDTLNDPVRNDDDFTPDGSYRWNTWRYHDKLQKIGRVIRDLGGDTLPVLIGLCEVENRQVLEELLEINDLDGVGYRILHNDSPDYRGIDVALIYREPYFRLLSSAFWPVWFPFDTLTQTREVLYAKGVLADLDTLHLFVNHWPSRSGGEVQSRPRRIFVAELLRTRVDSILRASPGARIIITGDLNDEPQDLSVVAGLNALREFERPEPDNLYALSGHLELLGGPGSYKYRGAWNFLDQFVVSGSMLDTTAILYSRLSDHQVFAPAYLQEEDPDYLGTRPFRTYTGPVYRGGFSDHFPVFLNIRINKH